MFKLSYQQIEREVQYFKHSAQNKEFQEYINDVVSNISKEYNSLKEQAQNTLNKSNLNKPIEVTKVELSGSYAKGTPTEDSDIDIKVFYVGEEDPTEVATTLAGQLFGDYGSYDVHAQQIKD